MVILTDDVTWPQRCCEAVRSAIIATAWLLVCFCKSNSVDYVFSFKWAPDCTLDITVPVLIPEDAAALLPQHQLNCVHSLTVRNAAPPDHAR